MVQRRVIGGVAALGAALMLAVPGVVAASDGRSGYVYTETNAATGNAILAYSQAHDGSLTWIGTFPTAGLGTGSGLATVSYTHLRAHETDSYLVCRLLLEK